MKYLPRVFACPEVAGALGGALVYGLGYMVNLSVLPVTLLILFSAAASLAAAVCASSHRRRSQEPLHRNRHPTPTPKPTIDITLAHTPLASKLTT